MCLFTESVRLFICQNQLVHMNYSISAESVRVGGQCVWALCLVFLRKAVGENTAVHEYLQLQEHSTVDSTIQAFVC